MNFSLIKRLRTALTATLAAVSLFVYAPAHAQSLKITGTVTDENGEALIGAGVLSADGSTGTVTDINGRYTITVNPKTVSLKFSFLSYTTQEVAIDGRTTINVSLQPDANNALNEVVVIGYGTTKKQDLTGSVVNVKMSDIADDTAASVDQALQGRLAGVDIMNTSGEPGATTSIRIRGTRSINASNEPLLIVDGVIDAVADISEINSSDIESISVMKDASSTAIYGSRGANGVVLVTTKKGTTSKPNVTAKAQYGVSLLAKELDVMNAEEFIRYRNDLGYFRNGHKNDYMYDVADMKHDTNWMREVSRPAPYQNYTVSISGKVAQKLSYFASLGFNDNQGIIKASGSRRITGRLNLSYDFAKWFNLAVKLNYTYRDQDLNRVKIGGTNLYTGAIYLSPLMGTGDSINPLYENGTKINGPIAQINLTENNREFLTKSDVIAFTFKPVKGLTLKSQNSYVVYQRHDYQFWSSRLPARREGQGSDAYRMEYDYRKFMTENTASWKKKFHGGHNFDALLGFSASKKEDNTLSLKAVGLLTDDLKWNNMQGITSKENYTATSSNNVIVKESFFARANYNYKSRYYVTGTVRYDGSSNFAANNKWGFFPSAAVKWNIKNEKWMKRAKWCNEMSLRLSAGVTGNDAISAYRSLQAYGTTTSSYIFDGTQGASIYPSRIGNPNLTWEKTTLYNAALDMSFFKDRLAVTFEAYDSKTTDLLLSVQTIKSTGYSTRLTNLGQTSNHGWELSLEGKIIEKKKFGWTSSFTISHNNQMVDDIGNEDYVATVMSPGNTSFMMYGYKKGYPLNALWGFQYEGVWHTEAEFERNKSTMSYVSNTTTSSASSILGWPRYADQNNDGILSQEDLIYLGSSDPFLFGGLQNTFHLRNWKLGFFFSYSLGGKIYNYAELAMAGSYACNQYRYMLNGWHPVRNPESDYPRAGTDDRLVPSNFAVHDASYVRLKDVNLSYTFDLKKKARWIRSITVGVNGSNLLLFTKYNGFDPDVSSSDDGESISRRLDIGAYPRARKYVGSIQLKF